MSASLARMQHQQEVMQAALLEPAFLYLFKGI